MAQLNPGSSLVPRGSSSAWIQARTLADWRAFGARNESPLFGYPKVQVNRRPNIIAGRWGGEIYDRPGTGGPIIGRPPLPPVVEPTPAPPPVAKDTPIAGPSGLGAPGTTTPPAAEWPAWAPWAPWAVLGILLLAGRR